MPLVLTVVLAAPFGLETIYTRWKSIPALPLSRNWKFPALGALFFVAAVGSLHSFGASNHYIKEAGLWLKVRTPADATLYTDNEVVRFYAERRWNQKRGAFTDKRLDQLLADGSFVDFDYLAVSVRRQDPERRRVLINAIGHDPIAEFINNKGDRVLIFELQKLSRQGG